MLNPLSIFQSISIIITNSVIYQNYDKPQYSGICFNIDKLTFLNIGPSSMNSNEKKRKHEEKL